MKLEIKQHLTFTLTLNSNLRLSLNFKLFMNFNIPELNILEYRFSPEAATGGVLQSKVFIEISQNSQENTCAKVSFLIKLQA